MRELMETRFWRASRVTGKSLAETAETPCKYFARETVRSFTVSLWGAVQTPVRNAIPNLRQMCPRRSRHTGEVPPKGVEGEGCSQSARRFQIMIFHKSSVRLSPLPYP